MSLLSIYVKCADGGYYQDPVFGGDDWFICYDDHDPIELVIKKSSKKTIDEILAKMEGKFLYTPQTPMCSWRCFDHKFYLSYHVWLKANGNPPVKFLMRHGEVLSTTPERDCVLYE